MTERNRLQNRRASITRTFWCEGFEYRATASRFPDGRLAELFLDTGKAGSAVQTQAENVGVLVSLLLQHGVPLDEIRPRVTGPIAIALHEFMVDAMWVRP
jgi:hypothetical protein